MWDDVNPVGTSSTVVRNWVNHTIGSSLPGYRAAIAKSWDATTPFTGKRVEVTTSQGYLEWKGSLAGNPSQRRLYGASGDLDQSDQTGFSPSGMSVAKAESIASSKFYNEASNAIKAVEGLECVAELHKTARSIMQRTTQMVLLLANWRRNLNMALSSRKAGNRATSARRAAGAVSGAYLEWKFGYDPIAKDMRALAKDLESDFFEVIPINVQGKHSRNNLSDEAASVLGMLEYKTVRRRIEECSIRYEAGIKVTRYGVPGFVERLGMSPSNFVPTLYNLLPWTYMIDYFTNLGDMVSALSFDPGLISWCNKTVRQKLTTTLVAGVSPYYNTAQYTADPGYPIVVPSTQTVVYTTFARSSDRPDRIPSFGFKFPDFATESGAKKGINIAAVLATQAWGNSRIAAYGR